MAHNAQRGLIEDAQRCGFTQFRPDPHVRKTYWQIRCSKCPKVENKGWPPDTGPDVLVSNMKRAGWYCGLGVEPLCPDCYHPKRLSTPSQASLEKRTASRRDTVVAQADAIFKPKPETVRLQQLNTLPGLDQLKVEVTATPEPKKAPMSPPTKLAPDLKITRRVMGLLDANFDENKRIYRDEWTDERIAAEAKTTYQIVASIRREAYGELAEDPVVTNLKARIAELQNQWRNDLQATMALVDQARTTVQTQIDHLNAAIKQLEERRLAS